MLKRVISIFIIFSPFTSYFAISAWLRLPVVLLFLVYIIFFTKIIIRNKMPAKLFLTINIADIILLLLLSTISLSFLINPLDNRGLNHTFAYAFTFLMYFIVLKKIIDYEQIDYLLILKMFAISAFICGAVIIIDWTLINFFHIGFRGYFVKVDYKIANMLYYSKGYFSSVGGVAEEPGSMALFMNIICPLGLLYWKIKERYLNFVMLFVIYMISMVFLSSTAGIINIIIAVFFIAILNLFNLNYRWSIKKKKVAIYFFVSLLTLLVGIFIIFYFQDFITKQSKEMANKILLSDQNISSKSRAYVWKEALINWSENPIFGSGPGSSISKYKTGYNSVYFTLLLDTGIISLLLFLLFAFFYFKKVLNIKAKYRNYLLVPLITSLIHFAIVGDYYHAPFWILLIVIQMVSKSETSIKLKNENNYCNTSL